jgi:crotonobetainyl-CoA:carnitine CoA-transferase CaiB-like acyl-CoA transferase
VGHPVYAPRAGYDFIVQGMSGIMDLTGDPAGSAQKIGVAYADIMTGLYSVIAIQAALAERAQSGVGQHIDMALLDVMVGTLANQAMNFLASGTTPRRLGNAHPNIAPYEAYPTADSWIILAVGNDEQFRRCCRILDIDPGEGFATNAERVKGRAALNIPIAQATRRWNRDALLAALAAEGVPAGPINSVAEVFDDAQVRHRGMRIDVGDGCEGAVPGVRLPIRFSRSPLAVTAASPPLGGL